MVKEPDYNTFYSMPKEIINYAANDDNAKSDYDASSYYERKTFDGRTNILKFKLCHKYCIDCIEYGPSDNDQRCETCKDDYTYDYLMYMNRFSGSCVPYNYMYDVESKLLSECTSSSKYYYNKTRSNKKYCFKYAYQCPDVYPYLNTDTKECLENNPDTSAENEPSVTTELPNNNPTQKESPVSTELPINIQTQKESPATTELPDNTPTQKGIDVISTSVIKVDECSGGIFLNNTCLNMTNKEIYEAVKDEIVIGFPEDGQSFVQEGKNDYSFQVTTAKNEKEEINSNSNVESAVVDLGDCEAKLKQENGITGNASLIIYKFYKNTERASKKEMQFEVYNPYTYHRLNLSICQSIKLYVPVNISEDHNLYQNIIDQGYDPFDINDKFYREICTPYNSENGTDVLLDAREEYYYYPIVNETSCQGNCHYSAYSLDTKFLICECDVDDDGIVTLDIKHFDEKNLGLSFYSSLKLSNYKVVICYNLVFNFKIFCHNYGSIITIIIVGIYIGFMIYYCIKEISPVKLAVSKILFQEQNKENMRQDNLLKEYGKKRNKKLKIKEKSDNNKTVNYPPKKGIIRKARKTASFLQTEGIEIIDTQKSERPKFKNKEKNDKKIIPSQILMNKETLSDKEKIAKSKRFVSFSDNKNKDDIKSKKNKILDNYELNNLEFVEACELDKRTFCKTYISVLMREHIALVTFFAWKDYNIFYVKIEKFFILFCTDFTMNGLFFVHESMYKKYNQGEDFTFVQKIPQLLFTLLVSHGLEALLCYLCMTDVYVYEIKALPNERDTGERIMNILDKVKRKLVAFYVITFLLILFYWYFISAFCAVYQNTQKIFIRDSFLSFAISLIDPFFIYGITCILRFISLLLCCRKNCCGKFLYKLSDLIPFF